MRSKTTVYIPETGYSQLDDEAVCKLVEPYEYSILFSRQFYEKAQLQRMVGSYIIVFYTPPDVAIAYFDNNYDALYFKLILE